jgi:hypothetical protein
MGNLSTRFRVGLVPLIVLCSLTAPNSVRGQVLAAYAVTVKKEGRGTPIRTDPQGRVRVERGDLLDDSGKRLTILDNKGIVASWSFSPDGRFLAVGIRSDSVNRTGKRGDSGTIRGYLHLYDAASGKLLRDCTSDRLGPVTNVAFSKDSKTLFYEAEKYEEVGGK